MSIDYTCYLKWRSFSKTIIVCTRIMKLTILALFLMSFILVNAAINYKKYCKGKKYFEDGDVIPHLHCEKNAFMLTHGSKKNKKHAHFVKKNQVRCNKLDEVLKDPKRYQLKKDSAIVKAMKKFGKDKCPEVYNNHNTNCRIF